MSPPVSNVSKPYLLTRWFATRIVSIFLQSTIVPNAPSEVYSGPSAKIGAN